MHLADPDIGIIGCNGITGGGIPIAVGAALACKLQATDQVAVCFFGDGASNQGAFHEALNLAAIWQLPVVFVCENNLFGLSVPQSRHQAIQDIATRAQAYGIPGIVVDGNDVQDVHRKAGQAIQRARTGGGPTLLENKTYVWHGHSIVDWRRQVVYRNKADEEKWIARCPIKTLERFLLDRQISTEEQLQETRLVVQARVDGAAKFALESPFPAPEEALEDVYPE